MKASFSQDITILLAGAYHGKCTNTERLEEQQNPVLELKEEQDAFGYHKIVFIC